MRLIALQTIRAEKIDRSRSWLLAREDFPAPAVRGNPNLWDEADIDRWLAEFIAKSKDQPAGNRPACSDALKAPRTPRAARAGA